MLISILRFNEILFNQIQIFMAIPNLRLNTWIGSMGAHW